MKFKKCLALLLAMLMAFTLCACQAEGQDEQLPSAEPSQDINNPVEPTDGVSDPGPDVTFGLQTAPDPDFDSPATGDDSGKLYTIEGDYAYELDPSTLKPIGPPLDPITHEPVDNPVTDGENPSTPNNPQYSAPVESDPPVQATPDPVQSDPPAVNTPNDDTKLPNMGMFLEDD